VRWTLNPLHGTKLADRVYGANLTLQACKEAARQGISVYFCGSRAEVLEKL
jgi:N-acetylglucosaminyldiphosphoundecaprenol N-acetyl-beta-D-mannosaminyltransferase